MSTQATAKTVVEIAPDSHQRVRDGAKKSGNSVKRFATLLLDYALGKFEAGDIALSEPSVEETPAKKGSDR